MKYRADIDGLRTLAVMAVLVFHAGFEQIPGGFIGVDIFFVISGYLITRIIHDEVVSSRKFDFGRFYIRRIRRLFPTLATVILLTAIASWIVLPQDLFERFGGSVVAAILSVSNIFFWTESGYFDVESGLKPLLHTWSLSVEEQFYFVWPLTLMLLLKFGGRAVAFGALVFLAVLTFAAGEFVLGGHVSIFEDSAPGLVNFFAEPQSSVFFLTPFRIFEFACGAALVWLGNGQRGTALTHDIMSAIGLIMIGYGLFFVHEGDHFPSYNALIPCVGTALLIASPKGRFVQAALSWRPVVWVGTISYTLYLVHWPIMVLYKYMNPGQLTYVEMIMLIAASFVIAAAIYYAVEKPLRRPKPKGEGLSSRAFSLASAGIAALLIVPSVQAYRGEVPTLAQPTLDVDIVQVNRDVRNSIFDDRKMCLLEPDMQNGLNDDGSVKCNDAARVRMVTIGNSHEKHGAALMRNLFADDVERGDLDIVFTQAHADQRSGKNIRCGLSKLKKLPLKTTADACRYKVDRMADVETFANEFDILVLASLRPSDYDPIYLKYVAAMQAANPDLKVVILGTFVDISPYRCYDLAQQASDAAACGKVDEVAYFNPSEEAAIRASYPDLDFHYFSQIDLLCDGDDYASCTTVYKGAPIIYDAHHFAWTGIPLLLERAEARGADKALRAYLGL